MNQAATHAAKVTKRRRIHEEIQDNKDHKEKNERQKLNLREYYALITGLDKVMRNRH